MADHTKYTGVILAGGESRRMGRKEKAFLTVKGKALIDYVQVVFKQIFSEIIVVSNRPDYYRHLPVRLISDLEPGRGPLMGIYSALKASAADYIFVAACDMIFVQPAVIRFLLQTAKDYDFVLPGVAAQRHYEPLHAVYSRSCIPVMESFYSKPGANLRIMALASQVRTRIVAPEELAAYDPQGLSFVNINVPEDLACAELLWRYYMERERR